MEYQYYEFRALDVPLDEAAQRELRRMSTRALITPTSFTNFYNYADLRGNPSQILEWWFDALVHVTNWGTRELSLKLPRKLVDLRSVKGYADGNVLDVRAAGTHAIVQFHVEDEEPPDWDEEGPEWMPRLLALRDDLLGGDLRALYLGWLLVVQYGEIDPDDREPEVPPGLGALTPALRT